jgi:hypothetical protein
MNVSDMFPEPDIENMTQDGLYYHFQRQHQRTTAQSTINAFMWVARYCDEIRLKKFLDEHPDDRKTLLQIWQDKK